MRCRRWCAPEPSGRARRVRARSACAWVRVALFMLISRVTTSGSRAEPPGGDAPQGVQEVVDVEDAVLEQVAEGAGADEVDRVRGLDVLGEQQDPQSGMRRPQGHGGARAVVGVVGRHPDVDDGEVGVVARTASISVVASGDPGHDLVAGVGEQAGQSLAEQGGVLARSRCARQHRLDDRCRHRAWLSIDSCPPWAPTRSARPASPDPGRDAARPLPSSVTRTCSWPATVATSRVIVVASACLTALVIASAAT